MKIIEYRLISANDVGGLTKVINDAINKGWQPYGNPFSQGINNIFIIQAIVRYESSAEPK